MRKPLTVITYFVSLFLAGCSLVYRVDIHQGNVVSQEMVNQLKPGMTKRQVAYIMGTPMVADPFHDNRWDYVYSNHPDDEDLIEKKITLVFRDDELAGIQGDLKPGTLPSVELARDTTVDIPKIDREKTLWQKIVGVFGVES
jgi:outer membrane protein assembly factor BamE